MAWRGECSDINREIEIPLKDYIRVMLEYCESNHAISPTNANFARSEPVKPTTPLFKRQPRYLPPGQPRTIRIVQQPTSFLLLTIIPILWSYINNVAGVSSTGTQGNGRRGCC